MTKSRNIVSYVVPMFTLVIILTSWEVMYRVGIIPNYMLPSPISIWEALIENIPVIIPHLMSTLTVAIIGLGISIILGVLLAIMMDYIVIFQYILKPIIIISQNIPLIAIAPLFILWFGFGLFPKILVVILTCFFPVAWNVFTGFQEVPQNYSQLFQSIGAKYHHGLRYLKIPFTMPYFFAGIRLSATYAVMSTIISEWTGGNSGLGIFLIRSKNSFEIATFFAGIIIIICLSLLLWLIVQNIERFYLYKKRSIKKA